MTYYDEFNFLKGNSIFRKPLVIVFIILVYFIWIPVCFYTQLWFYLRTIIGNLADSFNNFFLMSKDELGISKIQELYRKYTTK